MPPTLLFSTPSIIEPMNVDWDWECRNVIVKQLQQASPNQLPQLRAWNFDNGYGATATTDREFFIAGVHLYTVRPFIGTYPKGMFFVTSYDKAALYLPELLTNRQALTENEVSSYLQEIQALPKRRTSL